MSIGFIWGPPSFRHAALWHVVIGQAANGVWRTRCGIAQNGKVGLWRRGLLITEQPDWALACFRCVPASPHTEAVQASHE